MSTIKELAEQQLTAYNASDLDAFVACYHEDVQVLDGSSEVARGLAAFRARYTAMFAHGNFGATVPKRLQHNEHCVDLEIWWRVDPSSGERREGTLLVRYQERDGKIGLVQFLR